MTLLIFPFVITLLVVAATFVVIISVPRLWKELKPEERLLGCTLICTLFLFSYAFLWVVLMYRSEQCTTDYIAVHTPSAYLVESHGETETVTDPLQMLWVSEHKPITLIRKAPLLSSDVFTSLIIGG